MANERDDTDKRQTRLEAMIEEFRAAQNRRLVKRGIALWEGSEAAHRAIRVEPLPPEKLN